MPIPVGPAIAAGASLVGSALNAGSVARQNKKSRQWSEDMYNKQFQDNIKFWNMQNDYNSPEQQMQRLKAANLNPALMYGGSGNSGQAGSISTPDVQQAQFRSPDWGSAGIGAMQAVASIYDLDIKQAQLDNLKADNTVKLSQAALIASQTDRSEFDLLFESELKEVSADARREQLRKMKVDNRFQLDENERRAAMNASSIQEAAERILSIREQRANTAAERTRINAQIKNIRQDTELKRLDKELKSMGIQPHDPMYSRILGRMLYKDKGTLDSFVKKSIMGEFFK